MSALSNLLIPAVLCFGLGFLARVIKSGLRLPQGLAKVRSIELVPKPAPVKYGVRLD